RLADDAGIGIALPSARRGAGACARRGQLARHSIEPRVDPDEILALGALYSDERGEDVEPRRRTAIEEDEDGFLTWHRLEIAGDLPGAHVAREIDDDQVRGLGSTYCHFELLDRADTLNDAAATREQGPQAGRKIQGFVQDESFHELCIPFEGVGV